MKKIVLAVAALGMFAASALAAHAADSIDPAGHARVDITAPSCAARASEPTQMVSLDSDGRFQAAAPKVVTVAQSHGGQHDKMSCLDSVCKVAL